jgi:hypothetical protein
VAVGRRVLHHPDHLISNLSTEPEERNPMNMLSWHNNPELKSEVVERLRAHRAEDSIVKGLYQQIDPNLASGYRGCAIGCVLPRQTDGDALGLACDDSWHSEVERRFGIPLALARLIDSLFEGLPTDDDRHAEFAVMVIEAIPVGADLSPVISRFLVDVLADPEHGVRQYTAEDSHQRRAVDVVADLLRRQLAEEISREEWSEAAHDAYAAYIAAADAPAADAPAAAACSSYAAAADAAAYAAYAATDAAYAASFFADADAPAAAARRDSRIWQAERLIHHLTTSPNEGGGDQ